MALSGCAKINPAPNHGSPPSPNDSNEQTFVPAALPDNPNCDNLYPMDAWAGLDKQRISEQDFINGSSGQYYAYESNIHIATLPAGPSAQVAHYQVFIEDRAHRDATTQSSLICSKNMAPNLEVSANLFDSILRADGSTTQIWTVGFDIQNDSSPLFSNHLTVLTTPMKLLDPPLEEGWSRMFFTRGAGRYEMRLSHLEASRETYISTTYLLK